MGDIPATLAGSATFIGTTIYTAAATGVTWGAAAAAFTADMAAITALEFVIPSAWATLVAVPL